MSKIKNILSKIQENDILGISTGSNIYIGAEDNQEIELVLENGFDRNVRTIAHDISNLFIGGDASIGLKSLSQNKVISNYQIIGNASYDMEALENDLYNVLMKHISK